MRHLIVTIEFPPLQDGGISRTMDETARALVARGESVRVLTRGRKSEAFTYDQNYPATVTRLPGHHWQRRHQFFLRLFLPFVKEKGAIVHTSTWEIAPAVLRRAERCAWKVLVHAHGREIARAQGAELEELRSTLLGAHAVLPVSAHVRDLILKMGVPAERVHLLPNAMDARRVQGGSRDRFRAKHGFSGKVLLTLARIIERKGQDTVIRALPGLPDVTYVIAGKGQYEPALRSLAQDLGVAERVRFVGFVPDEEVPDVYAGSDVYVMVSREGEGGDIEGFGITYLEAAAAGLPVVAGRSGGTADAVGEHGILVDPLDVDAVRDAIARAFASGPSPEARARVEREFSLEARAAKIVRIAGGLPL